MLSLIPTTGLRRGGAVALFVGDWIALTRLSHGRPRSMRNPSSTMSEVVARFEACCALLSVDPAAATNQLIAFRHEALALEWARQIIEQSSVAIAQFEAVAALRDIALSRWSSLAEEELVALREYLLRAGTSCQDRAVSGCALGAHASLWVRGMASGWSGRDAAARCSSSIEALKALIGAFGLATSSGRVAAAKAAFERDGLAQCCRLDAPPSLLTDIVSWEWNGPAPGWWLERLPGLVERAVKEYERDGDAEWREACEALAAVDAPTFGGRRNDYRVYSEVHVSGIVVALYRLGLSRGGTPDLVAAAVATARVAAGASASPAVIDGLRHATRFAIERARERARDATASVRLAIADSSTAHAVEGQCKAQDALDILCDEPSSALLDAWAIVVSQTGPCVDLFIDYVDCELEARRCDAAAALAAAKDENADLDPSDDDDIERYALLALLGRTELGRAVAFLGSRVQAAIDALRRDTSSWDRDATLEELRCCVEMATELLTDLQGTFAEVPEAMVTADTSGPIALIALIASLDDNDSPPVAASLARFLARFVATYVESEYGNGVYRSKPQLVEEIAVRASAWLSKYPNEPAVAGRAVDLVSALANSRGAAPLTSTSVASLRRWVTALLASAEALNVDGAYRSELHRACADLCLARHALAGGAALELFETSLAKPLEERLLQHQADPALLKVLSGIARSAAAQSVKAPAPTAECRASMARRVPSDFVVCRCLARISRGPLALNCARDVAATQLVYASPHTRATFLNLLPSLVVAALESKDNDDDDNDDALRVAVETVDLVLADGLLCDEPRQNARAALASLEAALPRLDRQSLATDVETARRFYRALGSLASLADHDPLPTDFARSILEALVYGVYLPDKQTAAIALGGARHLAESEALAAPHVTLLFDALVLLLRPLLTTDDTSRDDDAADTVLSFLGHLAKHQPTGLANSLALSLLRDDHSRAKSTRLSHLANHIDALLNRAPLSNRKLRQSRRDFQITFADFLATARTYLASDDHSHRLASSELVQQGARRPYSAS